MHQLCITALPMRQLTCLCRYEACAVAGLWLGPELVCGAALRLNFPPTSCAGLGRAPPAEVAAALVAGRWRPQLQVLCTCVLLACAVRHRAVARALDVKPHVHILRRPLSHCLLMSCVQVLFMRTAPGHGRRGLGRLLSCLIGRQAARAQHEVGRGGWVGG